MRLLTAGLLVCLLFTQCPAQTVEIFESWQELDVFLRTSRVSRIFLFAANTREQSAGSRDFHGGVHYEFGIPPLIRSMFGELDSALTVFDYVRLRTGVQYLTDISGTNPYNEYRGILQLTPRYRFGYSAVLGIRNLGELRYIDGDPSFRYRLRPEFYQMINIADGFSVEPYATAEMFYDSRYCRFNRLIAQVGTSIGFSPIVVPDVAVSFMRDWVPQSRNTYTITRTLAFYF
jgi:hypothetical protein